MWNVQMRALTWTCYFSFNTFWPVKFKNGFLWGRIMKCFSFYLFIIWILRPLAYLMDCTSNLMFLFSLNSMNIPVSELAHCWIISREGQNFLICQTIIDNFPRRLSAASLSSRAVMDLLDSSTPISKMKHECTCKITFQIVYYFFPCIITCIIMYMIYESTVHVFWCYSYFTRGKWIIQMNYSYKVLNDSSQTCSLPLALCFETEKQGNPTILRLLCVAASLKR